MWGADGILQRAGYDALVDMPLSGWAWEFARRSPALKAAALTARRETPLIVARADGARVLRLRRVHRQAADFGLHFFPDPEKAARETPVFWLPEAAPSSLDAMAETGPIARRPGPNIAWTELPGEKHFLIAPGRRPKLMIAGNGYAAQLAIEETGLPAPRMAHLSLRLGAGDLRSDHLRGLEAFAAFCGGARKAAVTPGGLAAGRLRDALIALDGELAGVSRRRIGEAIFGAGAVARGWDDGDESCKKRVKRLVEKGRAMMQSGYRKLL